MALNTGVSSTRSRNTRPVNAITPPIRNGPRQPPFAKPSPVIDWKSSTTPVAPMAPSQVDEPTSARYQARRSSGACSMLNAIAPVYSPPAENPCSRRQSSSRTGAATPIWDQPGSSPIAAVAAPISTIETPSEVRRPRRSPIRPNTKAPSGRATNATPYTANAPINPLILLPAGKNAAAIAAAV